MIDQYEAGSLAPPPAARHASAWRAALPLAALLLAGCSDGGDSTGPTPGPDAQEIVSRYLTIDLDTPDSYQPVFPAHYPPSQLDSLDNTPLGNPVTDRGATLGRVLFHDPLLSVNGSISCASCHVPETGFADGTRVSVGFQGDSTTVRAMPLGNAALFRGGAMLWDRRRASIEDQVSQPITDPVEMGFTPEVGGLPELLTRLSATEYYPVLFEWAFGSPEVTEPRMRGALAQFVRSAVSTDSRFDRAFAEGTAGLPPGAPRPLELPGFTDQENLGWRLFAARGADGGVGCSVCHTLPTLALDSSRGGNGLDEGEATLFKSPSLKNVAITGPWMHDGRFETLAEVVDHYNRGVKSGPALDSIFIASDGRIGRLALFPPEIDALVAFLGTLTDDALIADPRFRSPFR